MSCLYGAVRQGHLNVLQLWIEKGNFHPRNHYCSSMVLDITKKHDRTDIVDYLEWFNDAAVAESSAGRQPLHTVEPC
jgi:hypothetical protein